MTVLQDVFDVMVFIVLLAALIWYVLFARDYIVDMDNWGFMLNDDKTAELVVTSDLNIYDTGRMDKAELLLSAYVWDTKSLVSNTINYSTAEVKTSGDSSAVVFTPKFTLEVDADYRAVKLQKVKELSVVIKNATGTRFTHMYVPESEAYVPGIPKYTPIMYTYSKDKGLGNFETLLKYSGSGAYITEDLSVSARYGNQGDSEAAISGFSVGWKGFVVDKVVTHWEVIIN